MVHQDAGAQADRVPGGDGAVGPHLQGQLVIVGGVSHAGVLHGVVDLAHRRIDRIHGNDPDNALGGLILVRGHVSAALRESQFHIQRCVGAQGGDVMLRIEHLHVTVGLDVPGGDRALAGSLDVDRLDPFAVEFCDDPLHIQHDLRHIFLDARNGGELVLNPGDLDGGNRGTRQRGQQDASQ